MKDCINCIHWHPTGEKDYQGYCTTSINCVNSKSRPRFTPKTEVKPISEIRLRQGSEDGIKGQTAFMSDEDYAKAHYNKQKQNPTYPDMRQLTEESKKELRKLGRRK